jgi:hypothetical protein
LRKLIFRRSRKANEVNRDKADYPDIVVHFLDTGRLAGRDSAEVNLFVTEGDAAAIGDDHDLVVERPSSPAAGCSPRLFGTPDA